MAASPRARPDPPGWWRDSRDKQAGPSGPPHHQWRELFFRWRTRGNLLQRAGRQGGDDAVLDAPQRIADAALRILPAAVRLGRACCYGQRPIDRLDDIGHRDGGRGAPETVAAARALVR